MNPLFGNLGMTSQFQPPAQASMQLPNYSAAAPKDFGSRFKAALPDILMGIGTSLATNNWGNAGKFAAESRQRREQEGEQVKAQNATVQWLASRGREDLAGLVAQGALPAMQAIQEASKTPESYKPMSSLGKLRSDYQQGLITREQFDALSQKETSPRGAGISIGDDGQLVYNVPQDQKNAANSLTEERAISASATKLKDTISVMREAQKNAGYTGIGGEMYDKLDQILGARSGGDGPLPGNPAARAVINSGGMKFVLDNVQSTKGAISNKEMELFQQAAPGLSQTPQGNKVLLDIAEKVADRQQQRLAEMEKWRAANQGSLDGFEPTWAQYVNENPILSQDMFVGGSQLQEQLPNGVSEEDIQFTMQKHGLTRQQVLEKLGR